MRFLLVFAGDPAKSLQVILIDGADWHKPDEPA
jgi:hypothetical protein